MEHLERLIERTGSRPTPFLAIDEAVVSTNIEAAQAFCDDAGVALRPHIKTHKSSILASRQLESGAVGVTCATLSEAVRLGAAGVSTSVFVSTPVHVDAAKAELLARAVSLHSEVLVAVDSPSGLDAVLATGLDVGLMVEVDSGLDRTGAAPADIARLARRCGGSLRGIFTHGGHSYALGAAESAADDEVDVLAEAWHVLGMPTGLVLSAGSTPTYRLSSREPVGEQRPGTYVLGDHQQVVLGAVAPDAVAAAVISTVIHRSGDKVVFDAGAKLLTKDRASFLDSFGHVLGHRIRIDRLNDNHGMGRSASPGPEVGDRVAIVPNHICPVVNLVDEVVLDGGSSIAVDLRNALA